jgi:NAD(P)-dependent dehydrogenase (short-subunit alcohol dehydrogenase family)
MLNGYYLKVGANLTIIARREDKLEEVKSLAEAANKQGGTGKGDLLFDQSFSSIVVMWLLTFAPSRSGGKIISLALDLADLSAIDTILPSIRKAGGSGVDILGLEFARFPYMATPVSRALV